MSKAAIPLVGECVEQNPSPQSGPADLKRYLQTPVVPIYDFILIGDIWQWRQNL